MQQDSQEQAVAANVVATQSSLLPQWSREEISTMQQQNPDIRQAAQWFTQTLSH